MQIFLFRRLNPDRYPQIKTDYRQKFRLELDVQFKYAEPRQTYQSGSLSGNAQQRVNHYPQEIKPGSD